VSCFALDGVYESFGVFFVIREELKPKLALLGIDFIGMLVEDVHGK
jgi:hypothetical protein